MDLLVHAKELVGRGNTSYNAHLAQLEEIVKQTDNTQPLSAEVEPKTNQKTNVKNTNFNVLYLVGGLVLFGAVILVIGY